PRGLPGGLPGRAVPMTVAPPATARRPSPTTPAKSLSTAVISLRSGLVDRQRAPAEFGPVQCRDRFLRTFRVHHLDERKSAGAARFPVGDHSYFFNRSMGLEEIAQLGLAGAVRQVSNVKVLHGRVSGIDAS